MDTAEYEAKVNRMLSDTNTYQPLKNDPTATYKKKLLKTLNRLKDEKKITTAAYWNLYPTTEKTPRMYYTPKIHKPDTPLRPIVDYTGSIGYKVSRELADLLLPITGKSEHFVKNSKQIAEESNHWKLEDDEVFNSHDVVSLFTNTPVDTKH